MNIFILLALVLGASAHRGHSAPKPKACCRGYTAQCMACVAGITIEEFCQSRYRSAHKGREYPGCKSVLKTEVELSALDTLEALLARGAPKPKACCRAYTAQCQACVAGITKEEFCQSRYRSAHKGREYPGCKSVLKTEVELSALGVLSGDIKLIGSGPRACCYAFTLNCMACSAGVTEERYCAENPHFPDCKTEVELSAVDHLEVPLASILHKQKKRCCNGNTARCSACKAGVSKKVYCDAMKRFAFMGTIKGC